MKNTKKRFFSLLLSVVVVVSSVGYVTSVSFDTKAPYESASSYCEEYCEGGNGAENVVMLKLGQSAKKSSSSKKLQDFLNKLKKSFKITQKATTKKVTTTKKTTKKVTTTKKATTTKKVTTTTKKTTTAPSSGNLIYGSSFLNEAANAINKARRSAGVANLSADSNMARVASVRAKEISKSYSHTRPDGRKSYTVYADLGLSKPTSVAENIAVATKFENATDIVNVWLGSGGHRDNILNGKYTRFGMAWYIAENGKQYAVMVLGNG